MKPPFFVLVGISADYSTRCFQCCCKEDFTNQSVCGLPGVRQAKNLILLLSVFGKRWLTKNCHDLILLPLRILATDISPRAIRKAQEGRYTPKHVKKVQQAFLDKYFMYHDNYYYIRNILKQFVVFSVANLVEMEVSSECSV